MRQLKLLAYRACRAVGLFAVSRWLTRRHPKILCYHGFELRNESRFRAKLFMSPALFEQRMQTVQRLGYRVLPFEQAVTELREDKTQKDTVAITVDDGFHSFFDKAVPILARHRFPAIVYVTSYYVAHRSPVFRLMVQYLFWQAEKKVVDLTGLHTANPSVDLNDPLASEKAVDEITAHGEQSCDEAQRRLLCAALARALGQSYAALEAARVMELMRPEQLRQLSQFQITVGLHTHRHRFPSNDETSARREIEENRQVLRAYLGEVSEHFCYPSGEFEPHQWAWLDSLQVKSSTTCLAGLNRPSTPHQALFRILDGEDVHEVEFEAALCGFSDLLRSLLGRR